MSVPLPILLLLPVTHSGNAGIAAVCAAILAFSVNLRDGAQVTGLVPRGKDFYPTSASLARTCVLIELVSLTPSKCNQKGESQMFKLLLVFVGASLDGKMVVCRMCNVVSGYPLGFHDKGVRDELKVDCWPAEFSVFCTSTLRVIP